MKLGVNGNVGTIVVEVIVERREVGFDVGV